jgi:hypothetical protein
VRSAAVKGTCVLQRGQQTGVSQAWTSGTRVRPGEGIVPGVVRFLGAVMA